MHVGLEPGGWNQFLPGCQMQMYCFAAALFLPLVAAVRPALDHSEWSPAAHADPQSWRLELYREFHKGSWGFGHRGTACREIAWWLQSHRRSSHDFYEKCAKVELENHERDRDTNPMQIMALLDPSVSASALRFCTALVSEAHRQAPRSDLRLTFDGVARLANNTVEMCQKVLTGSLKQTDTDQEWLKSAAKPAEKDGRHGAAGRLDGVETPAWKVALSEVCKDECQMLVEKIKNEKIKMYRYITELPSQTLTCADRVVKEVEGRILGCCARTCGWNNEECTAWPWLTKAQKGAWEAECCTEYNILAGSDREKMCDATVPRRSVEQIHHDPQLNVDHEGSQFLHQDLDTHSSFLQGQHGPASELECPPPFSDLEKNSQLVKEWRKIPLDIADWRKRKHGKCERQADTPQECQAFQQAENGVKCCDTTQGRTFWTEEVWKKNPAPKEVAGNGEKQDGWLFLHTELQQKVQ